LKNNHSFEGEETMWNSKGHPRQRGNMRTIASMIAVVSLVGIMIFIAGCSNAPTTAMPNSPTPTAQPTISSQTPAASQTPPTTQVTGAPSPTQVPLPSQTAAPTPRANIIINHTNWDWYNSQPSSVFNGVAQLKIYFAHASVGGNILDGMKALNSADSAKYPLIQQSSRDKPPATTNKGTIYEYARGNPDWPVKISSFATYIKNGWNDPKVNLVMNKFCYIDPQADWMTYRDSMVALEAQYPGTKFIYWTMPLMPTADSDEVLRSKFNQNLRDWMATQNNKFFFDLADIEAWTPDGQIQTFTDKGATYQKLFAAYSSDEGHLNDAGAKRAATGLYSLFGKIVSLNP
jgi:hypothetical protein